MSLDEKSFATLAEAKLERISDVVDEHLGDEIDAEIQSGILTLTLEAGGQYVINKHAPNRQIWMSSPVSGASHFDHVGEAWVSTRDAAVTLDGLLAAELKARFGVDVEF